ncbi:hypothetical protein LguiB_029021 [Lonicera macranthoides]
MANLNEDDDDDEAVAYNEGRRQKAILNINILETTEVTVKRYKYRQRQVAHSRLWNEYFAENPVYPETDFRRRFRMRRTLFNRILEAVTNYDNYFVQKPDGLGCLGLSPHQKIVAALRHMCYGACADIWGEYLAIGESTSIASLKRFCNAIIIIFGSEYLRAPTSADLDRLSNENSARGFPGMLGSIDCIHWTWKNCPVAWQGSYRGHKHAPTIILEAVASYDTWIWNSYFGMPGVNNDLNVLARSNVFENLLHGRCPPVNYEINGNHYNMGYYLADGIYPNYATIVKSMKTPNSEKEKVFSAAQESVRKDVERAFGILQARFAIIRQPGRLWNEATLSAVMQACIILHNMIIDDERRIDWDCEYDQIEELPPIQRDPTVIFNNYMQRRNEMTNSVTHNRLRVDLVEHIWALHSES